MPTFLFLAACSCVSANGPAWVAELSAVDPAHPDSVTVVVPLGMHVAVGVYNTDAVEPQPPEGLEATVRVVWSEQRTVFAGTAEEREAVIPMYLVPPDQCTPTGVWAVELKPLRLGSFEVPVVCNTNTVRVTVECVDLPKSDIGYGFYTDHNRFPDPARTREYLRAMRDYGMNTFTPYAYGHVPQVDGEAPPEKDTPEAFAWLVDAAIEEGLVDLRIPLLALALNYEDDSLPKAKALAKHPWPEIVGYNCDEPAIELGPEVRRVAEKWWSRGARNGVAISGDSALAIGQPVNVWVAYMDSLTAPVAKYAALTGHELWVYNCGVRASNAPMMRYYTGVYTWAVGAKVCLTWALFHKRDSRIQPDGTWNVLRYHEVGAADREGHLLPSVALEGMADGIVDSRLLQALARKGTPEGNRYLADLRARVGYTYAPPGKRYGDGGYPWDGPDCVTPPTDPGTVRAEVLTLLAGR